MSAQCDLNITGMHCASCSALITRKLKKTPGVEEANVNYAANKARVRFDPSKVHEHDLVAAVKAAGYGTKVTPAGTTSRTVTPVAVVDAKLVACSV